MLLGCIKSPSISNPCIFQKITQIKKIEEELTYFYSDVLNSKFDDEITIDILDLDYML